MNNMLLSSAEDMVEAVAKSIARNRIHDDASEAMEKLIGVQLEKVDRLEDTFDTVFERLWASSGPNDLRQKEMYRSDARAAIAAINLKLLTSE